MPGFIELIKFIALFIGGPIVAAVTAAYVLRHRLLRWSATRKAWLAALAGPVLEAVFALFLILSAYATTCRPEDVCDMPAMIGAIGLMIMACALVAYPFSALAAYAVLRKGGVR
jgi:hypothetical protein